jgi:putative cell wall-binding protein
MAPLSARAPRPAQPRRRPAHEWARLAVLAAAIVGLAGSARSAAATPLTAPRPEPAAAPGPAAPLPEPGFARRLSGEVYGYLPYWEIDGGTDAYLRYDLLTDIALFSVGFTSTGAIATSGTGYPAVTGSTAATIVNHAHAAGVRVDLTVTSFGYDKNAAFFTNPAAMAAAAGAISGLVQSEGLDGVNLDVENLYNENFAAYGTFVGQLRSALRSWNPAARVSVATNGSVSGAGMAIQALANGADRVFIMGYSYRTAGTSPAGSISPIVRADGDKSLTWTLDLYASRGIAADRLLLGLPYYGRSWPTTSGSLNATTTGSGGVWIPSDDMAAIPPGTAIQHDALEGAKWFVVQDASGNWTQTYFDDPVTLRAKYALANGRGLAGVGIWTLGYDRGVAGYWDAIVASFGTVRMAGSDRYATAAAIAGDAFAPGVSVAYVATGASFPDALAAAAVAGGVGAPVLLVTASGIPAATSAALSRLQPARIVVVGGPSVVSDTVLAALAAYSPGGAQRVAGADRYATAAALSAASFAPGVPVAYLVAGSGFADAVSAAPAAARDHSPVLLTFTDSLPPATTAELVRLAPGRVVIVGGPSVVSDQIVWALDSVLHGTGVFRLAGQDRYATSAAVAATFNPGVRAVYAATGLDFPDALAAASAAGAQGSPMVLTNPAALPDVIRAEIVRLNPARAVIAGGTSAVSAAAEAAIRDAVAAP